MTSAAAAWMMLGRLFGTEKMVWSAMELTTGLPEPNSSTLLFCKTILAQVAAQLSYYGESERIYREILSVYEKDKVPDRLKIVFAESNLAVLLMRISRLPEAENLIRNAEEFLLSPEGIDDSGVNMVRQARALLCIVQGHYSEAESPRLDLLEQDCKAWSSTETLGVKRLELIFSLGWLGEISNRAHSYIQVDQVLVLVHKAYDKLLGPNNWLTLDAVLWECWNSSFMDRKEDALAKCVHTKE